MMKPDLTSSHHLLYKISLFYFCLQLFNSTDDSGRIRNDVVKQLHYEFKFSSNKCPKLTITCMKLRLVIALIHDFSNLNARSLNYGMIAWSHGLLGGGANCFKMASEKDTLTSEMSIQLFSSWRWIS